MLKTGAAFTGATLITPFTFENEVFGKAKPKVPSYLKAYEEIYAQESPQGRNPVLSGSKIWPVYPLWPLQPP